MSAIYTCLVACFPSSFLICLSSSFKNEVTIYGEHIFGNVENVFVFLHCKCETKHNFAAVFSPFVGKSCVLTEKCREKIIFIKKKLYFN
jgi:hypothetical protein